MIDEIDRKILRSLLTEGRINFRDLGRQIHLSPNATADRVRRLQSKGIIRGFLASLDPLLLGLSLEAYIDVKLKSGNSVQDFEAAVTKLRGIIGMTVLTGSFDIRVRVACKDQADLVRIIELLRTRIGAQETNSSLICREVEIRHLNI